MTIVRLKLRDAARAITVNRAFVCGGRGSGSYTRTRTGPRGSANRPRPSAAPAETTDEQIDIPEVRHGNHP